MIPITVILPKRILSSNGRCAGQVNIQDPHSIQDVTFSFSILSHSFREDNVAIRNGSSPIGQTATHLAHRMHGWGALRTASLPLRTVTLLVPLQIGTSAVVSALPIIGPPASNLFSPSGIPPQASMS